MQLTRRLGIPLALLLVAAAVWCVVLPPIWAHSLGQYVSLSYFERLSLYVPELVVAAIVTISLFLVALKPRLAVIGFVVAAITAPVLQVAIGSPSVGVWPFSLGLLCLVAWRLHARFKPKA